MPSFDTPQPISVIANVAAGSIQFSASDRLDTVVELRPRDPKKDKDVRVAEQTEVTYANGVLTIRTPKGRYLVGPTGSVDVTVELPTGSRIDTTGSWTQVLGEGLLGEVRVKTSSGDVRLDATGPLQLTASHGSITVDRVEGLAEITTSSGSLRVGVVDGPAVLKNSHGSTTVGTAIGDLRVSGANGDIDIRRAELGHRDHRPRHPARGRRGPWHRPAGDLLRRHRHRHPRGHGRLARRRLGQRTGAQHAHRVRQPGEERGNGRGPRPDQVRQHRHPPRPGLTRPKPLTPHATSPLTTPSNGRAPCLHLS